MSHFFYGSVCDIVDVFKAMFPDSNISQGMRCWTTKLSYLFFGIAPNFKQLPFEDLKKAPCFVVLFDESLNAEIHQERWISLAGTSRMIMSSPDICLQHFWTYCCQRPETEVWRGYPKSRTQEDVQVLMDRPSVNWKMLSKITERSSTEHYPLLINVGVHAVFM